MKIKHLMFELLTFCIIILLSINVKSTDEQWSPEEMISEELCVSSHYPSIVVDSQDNIHIIWTDSNSSIFNIFYRKSKEHGWGEIKRISDPTKYSRFPHIAIDKNDKIHIIFLQNKKAEKTDTNYQLAYMRVDAITGKIEINPKVIVEDIYWAMMINLVKDIAVDSEGYIHTMGDSFYMRLNNDGDLLERNYFISSANFSEDVSIFTDSKNNVYFSWTYYNKSIKEDAIFYIKYDSKNNVWGEKIKLISSSPYQTYWMPKITFDKDNNLHLVYLYEKGTEMMYYEKYDSSLNEWTNKINLESDNPDIDIVIDSKGHIHKVWGDSRFPCPSKIVIEMDGEDVLSSKPEVFYQRYSDTPYTCSDGIQNGDETGIDCGGSCLEECKKGIECKTNKECMEKSLQCFVACSNGKCIPIVGMPAPPCEESIWLDYPDCKWDESKCIIKEEIPIEEPKEESIEEEKKETFVGEPIEEKKEELEVQVSKEELGEKEQSKSIFAKIISFIKSIFS